jgi:hypothetical protein
MNKQGTADKKKEVTLMISQKLEICNYEDWRWQKMKRGYGFKQQWIVNYLRYKEMEGPIMIVSDNT